MASIEFGILREGSTISLMSNFRLDIDEWEFQELQPILTRVSRRTGIEFDLYQGSEVAGPDLDVFIDEIALCLQEKTYTGNT